jgi:hypothetical protein
MKINILILITFILFWGATSAQKGIVINQGAVLKMEGNVYLKLSGDHNFINHSTTNQFGGTVVFSGSAPQMISGDQTSEFAILEINNPDGVSLGNSVNVNNELMLNSGSIDLNAHNLIMGENADFSGSFSNNNMIVADGDGFLVRQITSNGLYLFPIGDMTSGADYTPVELDFISGTYSNGNVSIQVRNIKHPNNTVSENYLNRYWTILSSGINSFDAVIDLNYSPTDIVGNEADILGARWNGTSWFQLSPLSSSHIIENINEFGDFTGVDESLFTEVNDPHTGDISIIYSDGNLIISNTGKNEYSFMNIYASSGQLVYSKGLKAAPLMRVSFAPAKGIYFMELIGEKVKIQKKFVVR